LYISFFLDPDCLPGGRQGRAGDYPLVAGSQCNNNFYRCDANLLRTIQSCGTSVNGFYFGISSTGVWTCLQATASSACGLSKCLLIVSFVLAYYCNDTCLF